jgi:hypothetical protein
MHGVDAAFERLDSGIGRPDFVDRRSQHSAVDVGDRCGNLAAAEVEAEDDRRLDYRLPVPLDRFMDRKVD